MNQVPLPLLSRVAYAPELFFLHTGVSNFYERVLSLIEKDAFALCFVVGEPQSGKTHLALKLVSEIASRGYESHFIDGNLFKETLANDIKKISPHSFVVVDNAHKYFSILKEEDRGAFVNFVERFRVGKGTLLFLSELPLSEFKVDDHIKSRLASGHSFVLLPPTEEELPEVIDIMAAQRGIKLTHHKLEILTRRLGRGIPEISTFLNSLSAEALEDASALKRSGLIRSAGQ